MGLSQAMDHRGFNLLGYSRPSHVDIEFLFQKCEYAERIELLFEKCEYVLCKIN